MSAVSDLEWSCRDGGNAAQEVATAKLHLLHLEPIKAKLGDKWERLSNLVHKLFEKALRQTQGPRDHFLLVDELSYVVTFHNLSLEEAGLACASVAQKVCELLFGSDIEDIAVRSLVGSVPANLLNETLGDAPGISDMLERCGGEIIVTPKAGDPGWHAQKRTMENESPQWRPFGWIRSAHRHAADMGITPGFFPVWDLKTRKSASLFCSVYSGAERTRSSVRRPRAGASEVQIVDTEIALLNATAEYAYRVRAAKKVCALGVGVSYETLSGFHARIDYVNALKVIETIPTCPLVLRVEQVPTGTPLGRLAEIVTMLAVPNVRVTVEFQSLRALPDMDIRLGAAGLGFSLKDYAGNNLTAEVQKLVRRATEQKAFVFLGDIDTSEMLVIAAQNGVRFGSGNAIDRILCYSGEEPVPNLPLQM